MSHFKAEMHLFSFQLDSAPDPTGELTVFPLVPIAGFHGLLLRGEGNGRGGRKGREN